MKRLISAALALTLLSGTAAYADPHGYGHGSGHHDRWDGGRDYRHHRGNDAGAAIAVGVGLLALTAILASQDRERDRDQYNEYPPPPPPNGPDYGPGDSQGNNQGYGPDYGPQDNQDQPPYDGNRPYRQDQQ